jgi:hypothetical protein
MHYPQEFFFVLAYIFLGVRVDAQTCFFCCYGLGRNLLFELTAELLFRLSPNSDTSLTASSPKSDIGIKLFLTDDKQQMHENVI